MRNVIDLIEAASSSPQKAEGVYLYIHRRSLENGAISSGWDDTEGVTTDIGLPSIEPHRIRMMARGRAKEFIESEEASQEIKRLGWQFTRRHQTTGRKGGAQLEVRLEPISGGKPVETVPETVIHVTPLVNVNSILKNGVLAGRSTRPDFIDYENRVHFVTSEEDAVRIASILDSFDGVTNEYAMIIVKPDGVDLFQDPEWSKGIIAHQNISPDKIVGWKKISKQ